MAANDMAPPAEGDIPHPLSEKEGNTDDTKAATVVAAVTDPKFPLPVLSSQTSTVRYVQSFVVLSALVGGGIFGAWFIDTPLLQTMSPSVLLPALFVATMSMLWFTGTVWIDWWELVLGYWWLSMPIGAAAGLALVMNQEAAAAMKEKS